MVGVILGPDLAVRDDEVATDRGRGDSYDSTVRGYRKRLRTDPEWARADARRVILNTYRTLMSRVMKGCWVWCVDARLVRGAEAFLWLQQATGG